MVSTTVGQPITDIESRIILNKYNKYFRELESFSNKLQNDEELISLYENN